MYIFIFKATSCAAIYEVDVFLVIYTVNRLFIIYYYFLLFITRKENTKQSTRIMYHHHLYLINK